MTQAHPVPDVHARGSLAVENVTCGPVALLCTREGTNQIQLRAGINDPADAAQDAITLRNAPNPSTYTGTRLAACSKSSSSLINTPATNT